MSSVSRSKQEGLRQSALALCLVPPAQVRWGGWGREAQCSQHQCPRCPPGGHPAWPWPDLERTTGPILVASTEPLEWGIERCPFPNGPEKRSVCFHALCKRKKGMLGTGVSCGPQGKARAQLSSLHLFSKTKTDLFFAAKKPQAILGLHEPELWAVS